MPKGDALARKMKSKQYRKSKYNDDLVDHSSDSDIDFQDGKYATGERKVESDRKHVWASIVKKDIPRVIQNEKKKDHVLNSRFR